MSAGREERGTAKASEAVQRRSDDGAVQRDTRENVWDSALVRMKGNLEISAMVSRAAEEGRGEL